MSGPLVFGNLELVDKKRLKDVMVKGSGPVPGAARYENWSIRIGPPTEAN